MKPAIPFDDIEQKALELGWDDVGVTQAKIPEEEIASYRDWLAKNYQGKLAYMEKEIRCSPQELFPEARSALIFVSYYKQPPLPFRKDAGLIASYARGRDYHTVHRKRLKKFIQWLETRSGRQNIARGFSDSAPVLEKALAVQAGLGWMGKNTLLIHRRFGTFTLLSGLFTSLSLAYPPPTLRMPRCGSCNRCLEACPTQALVSPYTLDAAKCLSYHLIESKEAIPPEVQKQNPGYLFGCDICQDVCPHNIRKPLATTEEFSPNEGMGEYLRLAEISEEEESLYGSPLKRRGAQGLKMTAESLLR